MKVSGALILTAFVAPVIWIIWLVVMNVFGHNACLELGYRDASVTFTGHVYCLARVNQTDIVVPLSKAEKR